MPDEILSAGVFARLQASLHRYEMQTPQESAAAVFIMYHLVRGHSIEKLVRDYPFTVALDRLASAGLVDGNNDSPILTEHGIGVYNSVK